MMKILLVIGLTLIVVFTLQGCTGSSNWAVPGAASNLTPTAVITSPLAGSMSDKGTSITFTGSANDPEDGALTGASLVWTSDIDGQIGTGLTFDITTLSRGVHVITLTATDASGEQGTALITITVGTPWFGAQWGYRQRITISASTAPSDQTDFPALIQITDQNNPLFDNALANGDDILFTDLDGVNQLDHEIELYSSTGTEELDAWVRIPNLSSTSDTVIFMYYGNAGAANQENPTGVWDGNYVGVWHMSETVADEGTATNAHSDSSGNSNHGDQNGNDETTGKIYNSQDFDGNDYIDAGTDSSIMPTTAITIEAWVNRTGTLSNWETLLGLYSDDSWGDGYAFAKFDTGDNINFWINNYSQNYAYTAWPTGWHYVVGTWDGNTIRIYLDAVEGTPDTFAGPISYGQPDEGLYIGSGHTGRYYPAWSVIIPGYYFSGDIDEVRISNAARSADWIEASYNSQNNPAGILSLATEEVF